jgi:hypothetical protein
MGFKSKVIPYLEVVSADGRPCMGYRKKDRLLSAGESTTTKPSAPAKTKGRVINIRA